MNFRYDVHAESRENVYAGGIVGRNDATISKCTSSGTVFAMLVLHDSGAGSGNGFGHADYDPYGSGYVGGIAGYSSTEIDMGSDTGVSDVNKGDEIYSPGLGLLKKADYSKRTCDLENIHWYVGTIAGYQE